MHVCLMYDASVAVGYILQGVCVCLVIVLIWHTTAQAWYVSFCQNKFSAQENTPQKSGKNLDQLEMIC